MFLSAVEYIRIQLEFDVVVVLFYLLYLCEEYFFREQKKKKHKTKHFVTFGFTGDIIIY